MKQKITFNTLLLIVFTLIAVFSFTSCTKDKEAIEVQQCSAVYYMSDKYTADNVYVRTDILFYDPKICGHDLETLKAIKEKIVVLCADGSIEHRYYVIKD